VEADLLRQLGHISFRPIRGSRVKGFTHIKSLCVEGFSQLIVTNTLRSLVQTNEFKKNYWNFPGLLTHTTHKNEHTGNFARSIAYYYICVRKCPARAAKTTKILGSRNFAIDVIYVASRRLKP
jgi:hypothetical protein